jgi:type II secretory pathway pseudopilin PulG
VRSRLREESGFGLIELVFAMVMLNIGILSLVAAFQSGALALERSASAANATAVADKTMEVYRGLENKAIFLCAPTTSDDATAPCLPSSSGGNDVGGWPNGIPNSTSQWYSLYFANADAYKAVSANFPSGDGTAAYSYASPPYWWVTEHVSGASCPISGGCSPIPAADETALPSGLSPDPTKAVQGVTGPDGQTYPVFTYVVMTQPDSSAGWVKQVTVEVLDPRTHKVLATETSLFDPYAAP